MKFVVLVVACLMSFSGFAGSLSFCAEEVEISLPSYGFGTSDQASVAAQVYPGEGGKLGVEIVLTGSYAWSGGHRELTGVNQTFFQDIEARREGKLLYVTIGGKEVLAATHSFLTGWKLSSNFSLEVTSTLVGPHTWSLSSRLDVSDPAE